MKPIKTKFECAGRTFPTLTAALAYERKLRIKDGNFRAIEKVADVKKNSVWDERAKKWILPSGTVRQGRRPMFKAFTKAERAAQSAAFADLCYAASEPVAEIRRSYKEILADENL